MNDAGVGKDRAGIESLTYLEPLGVAAATISHTSARIGDGDDMLKRGVVSHCNTPATTLGCTVGQHCEEAAHKMSVGSAFNGEPPPYEEGRFELRDGVIGCDSASLVQEKDKGLIVVTGSHGGTLASRPSYGLAVAALGAAFNDAGVGIDDAGIRRLAILDQTNVAAVTVDAMTACIGDARSAWDDGIISHINKQATQRGVKVGMTIVDFADLLS